MNEVCQAIEKNVGSMYLQFTLTYEEWSNISDQFEQHWNFPNCVGAIDGKHIVIQPPANAGFHYYNYRYNTKVCELLAMHSNITIQ